jgi:CelD/BcsL family acetyltransferase involved in cellulose biosynthesis
MNPFSTAAATTECCVTAEEWDDLADDAGASPFLRPGWIGAWWRAFGTGEIEVLAVRNSGRLSGLIPIAKQGGVLRSPTNAESPVFGFLTKNETGAGQLAEMVLRRQGARRLDFYPVDPDDFAIRQMSARAAERGRRLILRPVLFSPYIATDGTWEEYERSLDGSRRREIRRRRRRLEERGKLRLDIQAGDENLDALLAEGLRLEASGWKAAHGTAINSADATGRFYREIAQWSARRGWLRLAFLRVGDHAVAFDFCIECNGTHYLLKTGYDPGFAQYGPGMIIRHMMIERAFSRDIDTYEFLGTVEGDNNRWKLDWTGQLRTRARLQVFERSVAGTVDWAASAVAPSLMYQLRAQAKRALGPSGRDAAKRARYLLRRALKS